MGVDEIAAYLAKLPADRRAALTRVRAAINARIPPGYEEGILYGGPAWYVPRSRLAETYNGQPLALAVLASRKQYMALYLMAAYGPELNAWFRAAYRASGKKLDMGKACVRFRAVDDLALDVVGELLGKLPVDAYVALYERSRPAKPAKTPAGKPAKPSAAKKPAAGKPANKPVKKRR
jgi:hypothetical protein